MNSPIINPGIGVAFWMLIAFGILVFILAKFGWPMLLKALHEREEAIEHSLGEAAAARQELLHQAKLERDEMLRNARLTSEQIIEEARSTATAEANRIVESARESINYEKLKAMHELKNQIANLSIEIAEKLIREELSDKPKADALIQKELELMELK